MSDDYSSTFEGRPFGPIDLTANITKINIGDEVLDDSRYNFYLDESLSLWLRCTHPHGTNFNDDVRVEFDNSTVVEFLQSKVASTWLSAHGR